MVAPRRSFVVASLVSTLSLVGAVSALGWVHGCKNTSDTPNPLTKEPSKDPIDGVAVTETLALEGALEPIRVVRDKRGMVHIYAKSLRDATLAQGFMAARDRAPQLEILRRAAEGRLAEYAGNLQKSLADRDIFLRAIGFRRTAQKYYDSLDPKSDVKAAVDGYAQGITSYFRQIRDGSAHVPNGWLAIPRAKYTDWDAVSSLALARLLTFQLSYTGGDEIDFTKLYHAVHDTFRADATDPALSARVGIALDAIRFEPAAKVPVVPLPGAATPAKLEFPLLGAPARIPNDLYARIAPMLQAERAHQEMLGRGGWSSNNWVIGPGKSATGHSLVASDPHLGLPAPAVFHMVSLHVAGADASKDLDVAGMSFAGTPGVVLGFNKHIAWGATVAVFDVNDVYVDKIKADGTVTIGGKNVAIVPIVEQLDYGDGHPQSITIESIPGHGVIFPTVKDDRFVARAGTDVMAVRWTGMEPTGELEAFLALNRAKSVDEAKAGIDAHFEVGAQNFVIGDDQGNIGYTAHALVPLRPPAALAWDAKTWTGQLPCLALPGDAGLEWTGRVDDAMLPQAKNPAAGYIATANSDQYGLVFDNDPSNGPLYLSCLWDVGFRRARVGERIDAGTHESGKLTPDDVASIQADAKSPLGARIGKHFVAAIARAKAAKSGGPAAPDLKGILADPRWDDARMQLVIDTLQAWGAQSDYDAASGVVIAGDPTPSDKEVMASQAAVIFNAAMVPLLKYAFDDEIAAMVKVSGAAPWRIDHRYKGLVRMLEKPEALATADASGESVLWDDLSTPDVTESKDERLLRAMLDGLDFLVKTFGADPAKWRWGQVHTIRFATMVAGTDGQLSIPPRGDPKWPTGGFPRHGDMQVIDRSDPGLDSFDFSYASGPAQRMVADLDPSGPIVRNALPGGNVWIPDSPHFDDEAQMWRRNLNAPVRFSPDDVAGGAEERIDITPPK